MSKYSLCNLVITTVKFGLVNITLCLGSVSESSSDDIKFNEDYVWPKVHNVPEGGAALINCKSFTPTVWMHNGSPLTRDIRIFYSSQYIILPELSSIYEGIYTCIGATNSELPFEASSQVIISTCKLYFIR